MAGVAWLNDRTARLALGIVLSPLPHMLNTGQPTHEPDSRLARISWHNAHTSALDQAPLHQANLAQYEATPGTKPLRHELSGATCASRELSLSLLPTTPRHRRGAPTTQGGSGCNGTPRSTFVCENTGVLGRPSQLTRIPRGRSPRSAEDEALVLLMRSRVREGAREGVRFQHHKRKAMLICIAPKGALRRRSATRSRALAPQT